VSANFKKVWYASCVKCAKQAPLVDGSCTRPETEHILEIYGWTFPHHKPHCPRHSKSVVRQPKEEPRT
jgi:hypothetical protein